ncbi:ABC transporter permease [Brucella pseudogrignonensis]|uniref:ABC transporter permease n=1 Tax=Brucella pseudogrignonensis TaxID=419475 RepID=UPI003D96BE3B
MNFELMSTYGPKILWGLTVTLQLVLTSALLGAVFALPLALLRNSAYAVPRYLAKAYIVFFRGTPLLGQIFLIYYGAGQIRAELTSIGLWWFFRDAYLCALFAFTLNTTAYQAEILRGALSALPRGQLEAANSLGLSRTTTFFQILLPQALIIALRPLGNELILSLKASALASVITVPELMQATKLAFSRSFDFQVYIWAAILYLLMVETIRRLWAGLEIYLTRHLRHRVAPPNQPSVTAKA